MAQWRADGNGSDMRPGQACCPSGDDGGSLNGGLGQTCYSQFLDPRSFIPSFFFSSPFVFPLGSLRYLTILYDTSQRRGKRSLSSFPRASLSLDPGLKTSRLNQMHVSKPKQKNCVQ